MAVTLATATRNAACNAIVDLIDAGAGAGTLKVRTAAEAVLATITFADPAFGAAATGVATSSNSAVADTNASAGTATIITFEDSDSTEVLRCTASATGGGGDIEISPTNVIAAGQTVSLADGDITVTVPAS